MLVKHKKLTKGNGLTIPKDLRASFGLFAGNAVDLEEREDGILIKKHTPTCFCCGSSEEVIKFKGFEICNVCRKELTVSDE